VKVLVAPGVAGTQADDFHWAVPGELVTLPMECDRDGCGCDRAWIGAVSRAGTTTAVVADLPLTRTEYVQALDDTDRTGTGRPPGRAGRISREASALAHELLRVADRFDVGDVLERFGPTIEAR